MGATCGLEDRRCECGLYPSMAAGGQVRSYQQWAHVFLGCLHVQAVLGPVLKSLPQEVSSRPAHLWLFEAPSPCVRERDWWVLALSALSAMSRFRRQFVQGGMAQVQKATTSFFQSLKQDFADSQR